MALWDRYESDQRVFDDPRCFAINDESGVRKGYSHLFGHGPGRWNLRQYGLRYSKSGDAWNGAFARYRGGIKERHRQLCCAGVDHTGSSGDNELIAGQFTPVGRPGTSEEVGHVVVFLASEEASYVTGQLMVVDGGNTIQEYKVELT